MLYADRCIVFDTTRKLWTHPRDVPQRGSMTLQFGVLTVKDAAIRARLLLLGGVGRDPQLGLRMALGVEYRVRPVHLRTRVHHNDVMLIKRGATTAGPAVGAVVFYRVGPGAAWWPDLVALEINLMCLCRSLYEGQLSRTLYLRELRRAGVIQPVDLSNATDVERDAAAALLQLLVQ